ncbi:pyridoxamine 5'-phosphate oxidase family protein [Streptomyces sp. NPDC002908]|uniref:pyridoxamine 5'-phosphate oxidase family protein n=1 Tax=Streptomyces sp. NPDC002908 TaxID=3364670 RepID=UPI0036B7033B
MSRYAQVAFTGNVRRVQEERGSARAMDRLRDGPAEPDRLGPREAEFIGARDGFYLGTVGEDGWPYIQHRGGPAGFVHVVDEGTLAFAEVRGNRQYITAGNLRGDDRVSLFFMDYAHQARLKVLGRAETRDAEDYTGLPRRIAEEIGRLGTDGPRERLVLVRVEGLAWNCAKHITPRYSQAELADSLEKVAERLAELEAENRELRELLIAGTAEGRTVSG